jgi:hypothetical protein
VRRAGWRVPVGESSDPMPAFSGSSPPSALVAARFEAKYFVARAAAAQLREQLATRLSSHHHSVPPGGLVSSAVRHITTTVYFDTARRDLCRAAMRMPMHLKVRARTYHDEPSFGGASEPLIWVEIKERDGARSRKRRAPVERAVAGRWFAALALDDQALVVSACDVNLAAHAEPAGIMLLSDLTHTRVALGAPLLPSCVVRYRREAFQDAPGTLRITLDHDVQAFSAPRAPFASGALAHGALGAAMYEEAACVLEAKSIGGLPDWLTALLAEHGARAAEYSKLVMASQAVHGAL